MRNKIIEMMGYYTPTGDGFGGADWAFIVSSIILILSIWFVFKLILSLFR